GTAYFFKLTASSVGGAAGSATPHRSFTTRFVAPMLASFVDLVSLEPTFTWNAQAGIASYTLEIDDDANVADAPLKSFPGLTASAFALSYDAFSLGLGRTYHWRVVATDALGRSEPSPVASFETLPASVQPVMNYPSAGAQVPPSGFAFSFSPMTTHAAYRYRVQVDVVPEGGAPDWKDLVVDADGLTASPYAAPALAEGTRYAWRVITYRADLLAADPLGGKTVHVTAPIPFSTTGGTSSAAVPSNPVGGLTVYTLTPTLAWYLSAPASAVTFEVRYRVKATGTNFPATPQASGLSALTFTTPQLEGGKQYGWQVRVCSAATTCGAWSNEATFAVNAMLTTPVIPTISYPTGGVLVYGTSVRMSWYAPGAPSGTRYTVYAKACATASCAAEHTGTVPADNAGYTAYDAGTSATFTFTMPTSAPAFVWYVRSELGTSVSAASARAHFRFAASSGTTSARPVTQEWPKNGQEVTELTPGLRWWPGISGTFNYQVCVGMQSTPAATPSCAAPATTTAQIHTVLPGTLAWGTTYYWHVRTGSSAWSTTSFRTAHISGTLTPVASWPVANAAVNGTSTTLSWYVNGGQVAITGYTLELYRGSKLVKTYSISGGSTQKQLASGLIAGSTYQWRVASLSNTGQSPWSSFESFRVVAPGSSVVPVAESPAAGAVIPGGTEAPVLSWSLPVETDVPLTFDVEVASTEDMAGAQVFANVVSAEMVLAQLSAGEHYWRVRSKTAMGDMSEYSDVEHFTTQTATAVESAEAVPTSVVLESVYPNPATIGATVRFGMPVPARVRVVLYDALGRERAVLVDEDLGMGMHRAPIDASSLPSGVYVVRMSTGTDIQTRPLVIAR
ncbi:MAG TPA: T9SS type A sorting domain-containing protein, partial [Rhodothermales bacterium]|nr:T9SS type A sorting domain-containing protein [Rhodothermales bacterium]